MSESAALGAEVLRRARLTQNPTALAAAVNFAAGAYLHIPEPDFEAGLAFLEANPVDPESAGGAAAAVWLHRHWGVAYLGVGHADRAAHHLARSLRFADHRFPFMMNDTALALAVALGEAGHPTLATQLDGYTQVHLAYNQWGDPSLTWLQPRLEAVEDTLGTAERTAALEAGARLDRRGFMRLLADAEHLERRATP